MNALVIGGTGFLGSHLVPRLLDQGAQVRVFGRRTSQSDAPFKYFRGDINEKDSLREAMEGVDRVFHLAWTTVPQTSNDEPQWDLQSNVTAGLGVLEACSAAGVGSIIFPSSGGTVYGPAAGEIIDETSPTDPICSYGITKLAMEKYLALYRRLRGLDYRVLRVTNAYGEGQATDRPQGLIAVALNKVARSEPITVWGDGASVRDYVYAGDVADCLIKSAFVELAPEASRVFNVSSESGITINEVIEAIKDVTGRAVDVHHRPARSCDLDRAVISNKRARTVLKWSPRTSFREGLARTWDWVRSSQTGDGAK